MTTRYAITLAVIVLVLASSQASAEPIMFTYEGRISNSYSGLLGALGIDPSQRVVFSFIVERESADPVRTAPNYAHRDVLASTLTIGAYSMRGGSGLTQIFNGPLGTVNYDQFYAYSNWRGELVPFNGRWLHPEMAYLTLQGNANVISSGAYPLQALDPNPFTGRTLNLHYEWADDRSRGVAITVTLDRASTTPISVPEPGTLALVTIGAFGLVFRRFRSSSRPD